MRREYITVSGEPKGKGRPRFTRSGHAYTPSDTRKYEQLFADAWGDIDPIEWLPVRIVVTAYFKIPKSASKADKLAMLEGDRRPTKKPDIDNIVKAALDGLNGVAFTDDSQVVELKAFKFYSPQPRVEVMVEEVIS